MGLDQTINDKQKGGYDGSGFDFKFSGYKYSGIVDNTFFDILKFESVSAQSITSFCAVNGILSVLASNATGVDYATKAQNYNVLVSPNASDILTLTSNDIPNPVERSGNAITITLQEKAGSTNKLLIIQAKFTHASFGIVPRFSWVYRGQMHSRDVGRNIKITVI